MAAYETMKGLQALSQHLEWFPTLVSNRVTQLMRKTSSAWSPQLHRQAAHEVLELMRNTFFDQLRDLGGRVAFPRPELGETDLQGVVLFRWYAPEKTVALFSDLDPDSPQGRLVARSLCLLAEHQLHSLRGSNLEQLTSEDDCFLTNVGMLPGFYRGFGVFGWATYFEQIVLAQRDGYLEEFVVLSPFGNRGWVYPKPRDWTMIPPDALLALLLQIAEATERVLTSSLCRSEPPSPIRRMILDLTSSVVLSTSPDCFVNLMRSFNEQRDAGLKRARLVMDTYERIRQVHLVAVGHRKGTESTQ